MLRRLDYLEKLSKAVDRSPVTALVGPRQCGKTTLARELASDRESVYLDLESPSDAARLQNPELALSGMTGLVILDEIQTMPHLFPVLRSWVDRPDNTVRFLLLGSASPAILKNVSESLAGRVEFVDLSGFNLSEVGTSAWKQAWFRGGFPRSFLAQSDADSLAWRDGFIRTFLERDVPGFGISIPPAAMRRFWTMLAHTHGRLWNASDLARSMGLSDKTVRAWLDILTGTYMIRQLQPWFTNISKRQVKAPKIYFRDSGLLHTLLTLTDINGLLSHPAAGSSWEGFVLEQVVQIVRPSEVYFWATYSGAELDLLFFQNGKAYGVEIKLNETPTVTRGMRTALQDLGLEHLWVVYPGTHAYGLDEIITVLPVTEIWKIAMP